MYKDYLKYLSFLIKKKLKIRNNKKFKNNIIKNITINYNNNYTQLINLVIHKG